MTNGATKLAWILVVVGISVGFCQIIVAQVEDPIGPDAGDEKVEKKSSSAEMETWIYRVPQKFLFGSSLKKTAQEIFEDAGVIFGEGAVAIYSHHSGELKVVNTVDQLELIEAYLDLSHYCGMEKSLHVLVEYIEVEASLYHDWMFENEITGDGTPLRKQAQKWVKSNQGTIVETVILNVRSGQRAKTESVKRVIFTSEGDPPEIPNDIHLEGRETKVPITAGTPTAFETRNVGTTLELDPVLGADELTIDLSLSPEIVKQKGFTHWPPEREGDDTFFTISMPEFYTNRTTTQVTTVDGSYAFLGTSRPIAAAVEGRKNPLVLQFVRADIARLGDYHGQVQQIERIK